MKIKLSLSVVLLVFAQLMLWSQSQINSPYSREGYGQLADPSFGAQKAMGGIGYGLRESNMINPMNPASFSKVDSMTFMFDFALSGQISRYDDGYNKVKNTNAGLDYVAMQFPLSRNLGMGLGFKPVTYVGYKYGKEGSTSTETYTGSGGLNQIYGALSYSFKQLSVGVTAGYLFGNNYYEGIVATTGNPTITLDTLSMSGLNFDFGLQYTQPLRNGHLLTVGAVYTPELSLGGELTKGEYDYASSSFIRKDVQKGYDMPETYALGFSYAKEHQFLVGADYSYQKWSDAEFGGRTNMLSNRTKINVGGEFVPNARGRNYLGRVHYRVGGNYADSYVSPVANGTSSRFNEYGVSCGFGFPLTGGRSVLNLAFEYRKLDPKEQIQGMIKEQYYRFTISYTFNELWFFQRKVQ